MSVRIPVITVIVNYRSAELVRRCLAALRAELDSDVVELRAVVVENASGDAEALSAGIADQSDFARLVVAPKNGGFGYGNNLGLRTAVEAGLPFRYAHFLNPDTEIRPRAVTRLVEFLEEHPRAGIAGGSFVEADGTPWQMAFRFPSPASELEAGASIGVVSRLLDGRQVPMPQGDLPAQADWLSGASVMCRRELLEQVGGFDEGYFLYFEEVDLCLRARRAGWEVWYVPDSRVMHVRGQSTGVGLRNARPERLPPYWFESRRRYFAKNHPFRYAALADAAFVLGQGLGKLKHWVKREHRSPPFVIRDGLGQSVILPRNRRSIGPEVCYRVPRG